LNAGRETIVVADHTKCGVISTAFLAPLTTMRILVTDSGTDTDFTESLRAVGVEVVVT
jgi:DeoR/GlpR family transcriptional regulator of sugar metabolism